MVLVVTLDDSSICLKPPGLDLVSGRTAVTLRGFAASFPSCAPLPFMDEGTQVWEDTDSPKPHKWLLAKASQKSRSPDFQSKAFSFFRQGLLCLWQSSLSAPDRYWYCVSPETGKQMEARRFEGEVTWVWLMRKVAAGPAICKRVISKERFFCSPLKQRNFGQKTKQF